MNTTSILKNVRNVKPFDFFAGTTTADRKIQDWKLHEANRNNAELLARAAREASKTRFAM